MMNCNKPWRIEGSHVLISEKSSVFAELSNYTTQHFMFRNVYSVLYFVWVSHVNLFQPGPLKSLVSSSSSDPILGVSGEGGD